MEYGQPVGFSGIILDLGNELWPHIEMAMTASFMSWVAEDFWRARNLIALKHAETCGRHQEWNLLVFLIGSIQRAGCEGRSVSMVGRDPIGGLSGSDRHR